MRAVPAEKPILICIATDPATKEEQVVFFLHRWRRLLGGGATPQAQAQRKQTVQNAREFDGKQLKECYFPFDASDATKGLGIATEWLEAAERTARILRTCDACCRMKLRIGDVGIVRGGHIVSRAETFEINPSVMCPIEMYSWGTQEVAHFLKSLIN